MLLFTTIRGPFLQRSLFEKIVEFHPRTMLNISPDSPDPGFMLFVFIKTD